MTYDAYACVQYRLIPHEKSLVPFMSMFEGKQGLHFMMTSWAGQAIVMWLYELRGLLPATVRVITVVCGVIHGDPCVCSLDFAKPSKA